MRNRTSTTASAREYSMCSLISSLEIRSPRHARTAQDGEHKPEHEQESCTYIPGSISVHPSRSAATGSRSRIIPSPFLPCPPLTEFRIWALYLWPCPLSFPCALRFPDFQRGACDIYIQAYFPFTLILWAQFIRRARWCYLLRGNPWSAVQFLHSLSAPETYLILGQRLCNEYPLSCR